MVAFDCLARDCPLFGPHFLEASAGTGKTFSIEHIYVRLILESIEVEQILAVTFTRAATRELKARIRANLEKALELLRENNPAWDYLHNYLGSADAIRNLTDALAGFDRCQIFTIHGFCYRMLKEFAFEAKVGALSDPDEGRNVPQKLKEAAADFLENGIDENLVCPEQVSLLFKQFESVDALTDRLLRLEEGASHSFSELFAKCKAAIQNPKDDASLGAPESKCKAAIQNPKDDASLGTPESKCKAALHLRPMLLEDFRALEKGYKVGVKGDFEAQVKALANLDVAGFRLLLKERGSVLDFLDPGNRKVKPPEAGFLHYPGFFDWAREHIAPLLKLKVLPTIQAAWNPVAEKILTDEECLDPDEILEKMKNAIENETFASSVRQKYAAAVIDEFQDTDAAQWEIFQRLFMEGNLKALYFVGDPKQSIYRFRKADIYTYLKARDFLGEAHVYQLDTNFRSNEGLIGALNALFTRDWLHLPKMGRTLPYHPVKAGAKIEPIIDQNGAVHFFVAEGEPNVLFDEVFLPYAVGEIERLGIKKCAILVKDRYQAEKALELLKSRGIAAIAKSHTPLGETVAFQAIRELFEAVMAPHDKCAAQIVMAGPFGGREIPFLEYKVLLEEKGLVAFARALISLETALDRGCRSQVLESDSRSGGLTPNPNGVVSSPPIWLDGSMTCAYAPRGSAVSRLRDPISPDAMQIFELLFAWEKKEGFSFEGLKRFLKVLRHLEADEGGRRRMEVNEEAIQIMTMHISKGLEFDVVFALGLISRTPGSEEEVEEMDAEKQRQLYVAMTRAKKRLYVPIALSKKDPEPGTHSPMELFSRSFEGSLIDQLTALSKQESITWERLSVPFILGPASFVKNAEETYSAPVAKPFRTAFLSSFTTLAKTKEHEVKWTESPEGVFTLQTMPRGSETGIAIHQIFENLFRSPKPIWRDPAAMDELVAEQLNFSSLAPWKKPIQEMVRKIVSMPLVAGGEFFSLSEIDQFQVEMEFVFSSSPNYVKGFIDLVFCHRNKVYFLDWKTNWLEEYNAASLQAAMDAHDYGLQAALYGEAIRRHFKMDFGGAFYVFVRGGEYLFTNSDGSTKFSICK